jgi:uncharacterized protein YcbK (DUF882 family)
MDFKTYLENATKVKLSKNFSLQEVCKSEIAKDRNIDNRIPAKLINNAVLLIENVLQPVRGHFGKPVDIHSFYRCEEVNKIAGGEKTSQHLQGKAADFTISGIKLIDIAKYINESCIFDQLIIETAWLHCSYNHNKNRGQVLKYDGIKYSNYKL